jgi:hypothetical protein
MTARPGSLTTIHGGSQNAIVRKPELAAFSALWPKRWLLLQEK